MTRPSTASPRNSSRSLVGSPPFSYAYDRWVRARASSSASSVTPSASSREDGCGNGRGPPVTGSDREDLLVVVRPAVRAGGVRQLRLAAGAVLTEDQRRGGSLPLRPAGPGVAPGHPALRDCHCLLLTRGDRIGADRLDALGERRPAGVDGGGMGVVRGQLVQDAAAVRAQPGAVLP